MAAVLIDLTLSFIFFSAFYSKLFNFEAFRWEIARFIEVKRQLLGFLASLILMSELILSFLIVLPNVVEKYKQIFAFVFLLTLTVVTIKKKASKGATECNCFGQEHLLNRFPIQRNLLFLFLAVLDSLYVSTKSDPEVIILIYLTVVLLAVTLDNVRLSKLLARRS